MKTKSATFCRVLLLTGLLLVLAACNGRKQALPSTDFSDYVEAYTGGIISEEGTIRIRLASPAYVQPEDGLFTFSPALEGSLRWVQNDLVEFVPNQDALQPGKTYKVSFHLGKVLPVKDKASQVFPFVFSVEERAAFLALDRTLLQTDSATVEGNVTLSRSLDAERVRNMIKLAWNDGTPVLHLSNIQHQGKYSFSVTGLARSDKDRILKIQFSEAGTGFKTNDGAEVVIPAKGDFKVLGARMVEDADPYVEVSFSEPVGSIAQGLIELEGVGRTYLETDRNLVKVFFDERQQPDLNLRVNPGIRSAQGDALKESFEAVIKAVLPNPEASIPLQGNILPDTKNLVLPFRTVSLRAVDLRVIRIYEDNVLTFLQDNSLGGSDQLRRSGRLVYTQTIRLDGDRDKDLTTWQDWSIDLGPLFRREPGAIYRIRLTYKPEYALVNTSSADLVTLGSNALSTEETAIWDTPDSYYWETWYNWDSYDWSKRNDPTDPSYYMLTERFPVINLMTSDIGLIAKFADGDQLWVAATDINSAAPASGIDLEAYNFQLRKVGTGKTDGNGLCTLTVKGRPFVVVARRGNTVSYLKVTDGEEKSLSRFDVGGKKVEKGLKSFIYGERGVWRPGDTLHVSMILQDKGANLPASHPATLELYTPQGQFYSRQTGTATDGFYAFNVPTLPEDPTGFWNAYIKVGGTSFHKSLRIENVKPNRLKIDLDMGSTVLAGGTKAQARVAANWLTGPAAAGLPVKADLMLNATTAPFKGFEGYVFQDPTKSFTSSETRIIDTKLDGQGTVRLGVDLPKAADAPGMLSATIVCSVEEQGGDASFVPVTLPYSPYSAYVGLKVPEGTLETDKDHVFNVAVVDKDGHRVPGHRLEYRIFKMEWRWWWESRASELDSYVNGSSANVFSSGMLTSSSTADVRIPFRLDYPEWGRFLVYVKDLDSGHAAGTVFLADWPAYRGQSDKKDPTALTMLSFALDKNEFQAGETATVYVPAAKGGRALVSLENGSGVIRQQWVSTDAQRETPYSFKVTPEMAPNFYVHLTLLQPHSQTGSDLPLRLYGVQPVTVTNKDSHLTPVITMADAVHPEEEFTVKVSEKTGRTMTYTLALVDEGLLDLTAFKTPDPWNGMYAREALGVRTWDLFDEVTGAYSGRFSPMFSVGGDEQLLLGAKKDNRFNAVVRFLGPFTLENGSQTHKITLPMYVGSLRVMVVAGHEGAFGHAEKTVAVRSPLMVVPTLPRVLATGDQVTLPVNVFAMENDVRQATVSVKTEGPVRLTGAPSTNLTFSEPGDQLARFALEATGEGTARITVTATGAGHTATETLSIQVSNPNPPVIQVQRRSLAAKEKVSFDFDPALSATLTLTNFPAIDVNGTFSFVRNYSHYCTEQLSARGLTLLHTYDMLSEQNAAQADIILPEIIQALYGRQLTDGSFIYWPGSTLSDSWVTSMAGLFLHEAAAKGLNVDRNVLRNWTSYQQRRADNWKASGADSSGMDQAFRLYTLGVTGSEDAGAMNRLREQADLIVPAKWMLAAAYAACGKKAAADQLIQGIPNGFQDYRSGDLTYGSSLRDKAVAIIAQVLTDHSGEALALAQDVAGAFQPGSSSTQECAFSAMAMDMLSGKVSTGTLSASVDGKAVNTPKSVYSIALAPNAGKTALENTSDGAIHATLTTLSQAPAGQVVPARNAGIRLTVTWTDLNGNAFNPASVAQGTEFTATVQVTSENSLDDLTNLALTFPLPSGWEIYNQRLFSENVAAQNAFDYQDIRDDRSIWYFSLPMRTSKTFKLRLRAAYEGTYTLPSVTCEAMYDSAVAANTASGKTVVTR